MLYDKRWDKKIETKPHIRLLIEARKIIGREENWCRGYESEDRRSICAVHAMQRAAKELGATTHDEFRAYVALGSQADVPDGHGPHIGHWNDSHTHTEVLAAFDRAIAAA